MQPLDKQEKRSIIEKAALTISVSLSAFSGLCVGYYGRDFRKESRQEVRESGPAELILPNAGFPDNFNQLLKDYPDVSVTSIHPEGSFTTVRFRE